VANGWWFSLTVRIDDQKEKVGVRVLLLWCVCRMWMHGIYLIEHEAQAFAQYDPK
jgi:predicted membrane protein